MKKVRIPNIKAGEMKLWTVFTLGAAIMFYGIKPASIRQTTHYTEHDLSFLSVASSTAEGEKTESPKYSQWEND